MYVAEFLYIHIILFIYWQVYVCIKIDWLLVWTGLTNGNCCHAYKWFVLYSKLSRIVCVNFRCQDVSYSYTIAVPGKLLSKHLNGKPPTWLSSGAEVLGRSVGHFLEASVILCFIMHISQYASVVLTKLSRDRKPSQISQN